jgi:enoyl-CoA hydratase
MEFKTVMIDRLGPVWIVTLNRPQRLNGMSQTMLSEIDAACDIIEADEVMPSHRFNRRRQSVYCWL